MRWKCLLLPALLVAVVLGDLAWAQQAPAALSTPPPVLQIMQEHVKPGKGMAHEKLETAWTAAFKHAKFNYPGLAMTSISGGNDVWFLMPQKSWAAAEKDYAAIMSNPAFASIMQQYAPQEAEMLSGTHMVWARYREDLSYNPGVKLGEMRLMIVRTVHIRPGHDREFQELRKMIIEAMTRQNAPEHVAVYSVVAGGASTYYAFRPIKSLDVLDETPKGPMFSDEEQKKIMELVDRAIAKIDQNIFAFSPAMSIPTPEMVAAAPDYWTPKPPPVKAKAPAKAGETAPPVKKEPAKAEEKKK